MTNITFELFEDAADEWRWRARHQNGEIVADGGEGYASKSGAREAITRLQAYAPDADVLEVGKAAFEVYRDKGGEYRWRLVHRNGNILADSGEGYAEKSGARQAVTRLKSNAADGDIAE
ncbi:Uncharacterized conserved protein YegP, UPF0339 family [Haloplanus vescus]|uniref:Uncharacterized conserved protein YegP, UPF0339 family n=1 Tax=Haloplanus vescus TaxID=555874 RepID=A0A1H3XF58_9EURY|nr:Uncharacterized conserved protein YegP, UPF0339 family [Haloplanus vescus]